MFKWKRPFCKVISGIALVFPSSAWAETGYYANLRTRSTTGTTHIQDAILLEQKAFGHLFGLSDLPKGFNYIPPKPLSEHAPIVIVNNSGIDSSRIYFLGTGTDMTGGGQHFLKPDPTTGVCTTVASGQANSADTNISIPLSSLPRASRSAEAFLIYLPQQISGRCYLSIDAPLFLQTSSTTISPPSVGSPRDPTFYTLYQNFELTLDANYELWANISNVDFFSLPMGVSSNTYPSGNPYPTLDGLTASGMSATTKRSDVISSVANAFSTKDASSPLEWYKLFTPYYNNPYTDSTASSYLRILSAKQSIPFGINVFVNPLIQFQQFNPLYLQSTTSGPSSSNSYMDDLGTYFQGQSMELIIYPAGEAAATYTVTGLSGTPSQLDLTTTAVGAPAFSILLNNLTALDLLGGDVGAWNNSGVFSPPGVNVWNTEIAKTFSALLSAGFLPPPDTAILPQPIDSRDTYFSQYRQHYFNNPTNFTDHGPWYNLYSSALHNLMIQTDGYGLGYAYDYDDLLGLGGEMHVVIGTGSTVNTAYPYYVVSLGPVDTAIPNPTESFGPYELKINSISPTATPVKIYYSTTAGGSPTNVIDVPDNSTQADVPVVYDYFIVEFEFAQPKRYKVYPKNQYVIPEGTEYTTTDVGYASGIAFDSVTGSGTVVTITPPNV